MLKLLKNSNNSQINGDSHKSDLLNKFNHYIDSITAKEFSDLCGNSISTKFLNATMNVLDRWYRIKFISIKNQFIRIKHQNIYRRIRIYELAKKGWFISGYSYQSEIDKFLNSIRDITSDNINEIDSMASFFIKDSIDNYIEEVIKNNKRRANIIIDAFTAHKNGSYNLSVPVFIAQTDGICKEKTGVNLFNQFDFSKFAKNCSMIHKLKETPLSEKIGDIFVGFFVFQEDTPTGNDLFLSEGKSNPRPEGFNRLNRHLVMHGEDINYGTEINSLKALSLLCSMDCIISN